MLAAIKSRQEERISMTQPTSTLAQADFVESRVTFDHLWVKASFTRRPSARWAGRSLHPRPDSAGLHESHDVFLLLAEQGLSDLASWTANRLMPYESLAGVFTATHMTHMTQDDCNAAGSVNKVGIPAQ